MKKLLVVLVLLLTSGCWYSKDAGQDLETFVTAQSAWNAWIATREDYAEKSGIDDAYIQKLRDSIEKLCIAAGIPPAECDKFDPGPGDKYGDPPPPPEWPLD